MTSQRSTPASVTRLLCSAAWAWPGQTGNANEEVRLQVAAVSGDVRRCLELLRRAAEITASQAKQSQAPGPAEAQPDSQQPDAAQDAPPPCKPSHICIVSAELHNL